MSDTRTQNATDAVDVIMCTRNREASIKAAVQSVLANSYPNFTMTVVDQSTSNATGEVLASLIESDRRLRYVHVDEAGLSRAYNTGIAATSSDVLAFTDDDCVVPTNWIQTIVEAFEAEPDGDLLYGQVIPLETGEQSSLTPFLLIPKAERLSRGDSFRIFGMGANFAARRRLFDKIGGFDVVLGGGGALRSSQDFDLAYRAYKANSVILLRPEVTLRHDGRREKEDWPVLLLNYGTGDGGFYTKHIRCRDPQAAWLLIKKFTRMTLSNCFWLVRRKDTVGFNYLKGVMIGVRGSFGFKVDRDRRMYVDT